MITLIIILQTFIWVIMTCAVWTIGYSVVCIQFHMVFYISLILIAVESIVIVFNAWKYPLRDVARKYTDETSAHYDMYLPEIIATYNKEIFSGI